MPKKKVQHKGKTKHAIEESENEPYGKKLGEIFQEEQATVTDYKTNKFNTRPLENNWSKYENFESDDGDESHKTNDFDFLLKTSSSDCSHFEFSSEKQWRNEDSFVPSSNIFNVDLNLLSKGLACLPFYERIGLKNSELSEEDKESFDKAAAKNRKDYNASCRNLLKSEEVGDDVENKEEKTLTDLIIKKDLGEEISKSDNEGVEKILKLTAKVTDQGDKQNTKQDNEPKTTKDFFTENLEDWLDSMLDD